MLTKNAARELLDGLDTEDAHMNCYCEEEICDAHHPADEGLGRPRFGIAYVTSDGRLDHAANMEAHGWKHGALMSDAENVRADLAEFAEYIDERVVIDRETGEWWAGADFPG